MSEKEPEVIFVTSGVSYQWLDEKRILKFVLRDVSRDTIDKWYSLLFDLIKNWPAEQPYLVLYDMRQENVTMTPYLRQKASEMNELRQEVKGRIAVVLQPNMTVYLLRFFVRMRRRSSRVTSLFLSEEAALQWLRETID